MSDFDELVASLEANGDDYWIISDYTSDVYDEDGVVEAVDSDYWYEFNSEGKLVAEYGAD